MDFNPDIENLIYRYLRGVLTSDEHSRLEAWISVRPENRVLFERICDQKNLLYKMSFFDKHSQKKVWNKLERKISGRRKSCFLSWPVAASLIFPLLVGTWFFLNDVKRNGKQKGVCSISSGMACARLQLSDGTVIALRQDSVYSMELSGGWRVDNKKGVVFYEQDSIGTEMEGYNEIRTPRGGEYQIRLPDGTDVWLNTESALQFPKLFSGEERRVYAQGELYFEVASDLTRPFRVEVDAYTIEVTGTKFNVRTYAGGPQLTTLVSGGVSIRKENKVVRLEPGEEAVLEQEGGVIRVQKAEMESRLAWHKGYFLFDDARLEDIMNELCRWYNVEVFFEDSKIREERFSLELRRHEDFRKVLDLIERAGGVKITIKKNVVFVK